MLIIIGNHHFHHHRGRTGHKVMCPRCGGSFNFILRTTGSWATLFWIPIFPYRYRRECLCPYCNCGLDLSGPEYDDLLKGRTKDRIRKL